MVAGSFGLSSSFAEILQHVGGAFQRAPAGFCCPERTGSFRYRRLVTREVSRELRQLRGEKTSHRRK